MMMTTSNATRVLRSVLQQRLVVSKAAAATRPIGGSSFHSATNPHNNKHSYMTSCCCCSIRALGTTSNSSSSSSSFSMEALKELRARSGAPIVDCKKALQQSNNDLTAAMDWLRRHGASKAASSLKGRETNQGLVALKIVSDSNDNDDGGTSMAAALVKVASETDFAGRSSKFVELVANIADATLNVKDHNNGHLSDDAILQATSSNNKTVQDLLDEAIVAIRENISVSDATRLQTDDDDEGTAAILVGYVHNRVDDSNDTHAGTAAAVVEVAPINDKVVSKEDLQNVGKKLAMHIVAARPQYLSPDDVPTDQVEKEKEFLLMKQQEEDSGKPPEIVQKIVQGQLRKFYQGICLLEQAHMIEEKNPKVQKVLKDAGIVVRRFELLTI